MATAKVQGPAAIPGFTRPLDLSDLQDTNHVYNSLPEIDHQHKISSEQLEGLAKIFIEHKVQDKLGIHLIHNHRKLPVDEVVVGMDITEPTGCWNVATKFSEVDLSNVHGRIFKLVDGDRFIAYEYEQGSMTDLSSCPPVFFHDLAQFLVAENLTDIAGLEILGKTNGMAEFDLTNLGTVMLNVGEINYGGVVHVTGWTFSYEDGILSSKGNTHHAATTKGTHRVFVDTKPLPEMEQTFTYKDGIISCKGNTHHAGTTKGTHRVFVDTKPLPDLERLRSVLVENEIINA